MVSTFAVAGGAGMRGVATPRTNEGTVDAIRRWSLRAAACGCRTLGLGALAALLVVGYLAWQSGLIPTPNNLGGGIANVLLRGAENTARPIDVTVEDHPDANGSTDVVAGTVHGTHDSLTFKLMTVSGQVPITYASHNSACVVQADATLACQGPFNDRDAFSVWFSYATQSTPLTLLANNVPVAVYTDSTAQTGGFQGQIDRADLDRIGRTSRADGIGW